MKKPLVVSILLAVIAAALYFSYRQQPAELPANAEARADKPGAKVLPLLPADPKAGAPPLRVEPRSRYVLDVVLHSAEEIEQLLDKAEKLASKPRPGNHAASIAIVLHGPEIEIFSIPNYDKYKHVVDRAAKLDAYNIIDVKMCMTAMRERGVRKEDVPGFIELVPYGPEEIKRLQENGFVKL